MVFGKYFQLWVNENNHDLTMVNVIYSIALRFDLNDGLGSFSGLFLVERRRLTL